MLGWLSRVGRRPVTTRFPRVPEPLPRGTASYPVVPGRRIGRVEAERAQELCPVGALQVRGAELWLDLGQCTGCGRCVAAGLVMTGAMAPPVRSREELRVNLAAVERGDG